MDQGTAATATKHGSLPGRQIVPRPRLTDLLDASDARVVLLVAPAGYGKTTLIRQWIAARSIAMGWFSVSEAALDVAALALGLARAASAVLPAVDSTIRQRLAAMRETAPDAEILFDLLAAGLAPWPAKAWLVVDDYHALSGSPASEDFLSRVADLPQVKLLIASRQRPAWATARRLLYGEIRELGRATLAMTTEEAMAVLADRQTREVEGLAALADGWPAVIGLAALSDSEVTQLSDQVPETLHDFFAQELLNAIPSELQARLVRLAVAPSLSRRLVELIGGPEAERMLAHALQHGFLTVGRGNEFEMHPLLRQFLLARLSKEDPETRATIERVGSLLVETKHWDDAFSLIEDFDVPQLLAPLIENGLGDVLAAGRLTTLGRWVEYARAHDLRGPEIDLADAEIAFREGRYPEAEAVALRATASFDHDHALVARAWYRAAQSAHLDDRVDEALRLHERAAAHATGERDRQDAIWGQFISQGELDLIDEARETLQRFRPSQPTPEDVLREGQARISLGIRWDGITPRLLAASDQAHLLGMRADPVVRSAYLQMLGCALSLHGQYERALDISDRSLAIAEKFRLDFVLPHALYVRATALIGLRQLGEALSTIRRSAQHAKALDDQHSILNSLIVTARIALTKRRPVDALDTLNVKRRSWPTPGLAGEFHAIRSIAHACAGDPQSSRRVAGTALRFSRQLETEIPTAWAKVLAASPPNRSRLAAKAFRRAQAVGHIDTIVLAYRLEPILLRELASVPGLRAPLQATLEAGHDHTLARRIGMNLTPATSRRSLTPRESEVLDLLRQGMTNAEISRALWITEGTAKVHVRHVLEKLGVRSRVQAATVSLADDS